MEYLIGIDVGTSGTKTVLFTAEGDVVASCTAEYPMDQPHNGWAEQNPEDWWNAAAETIRSVIKNVDASQIKGIGLSGQMHGLVMLDESGAVLRPAILWCDGRTGKECAEITRRIGEQRLVQITANPALTGFTAGKVLWVRANESDIYNKCRHILLPKDYIRYKLTGIFATEASDASGTQLFDVPNRCWSNEVLSALDIDPSWLPKVYESPEITGAVDDNAAALTGLKKGTIVVGGAADNAAAAVGTGVVVDGKSFVTIGTSGVVYAHTSKMSIDTNGRVHTFCSAVPGEWLVLGCTLSAGLSLKWFRDTFCAGESYASIDEQAESSPIGANKLLFLPYLMGERSPHKDPDCRGVFFGLSATHKKGDMLRAVMEGVAYSLRDCAEVMSDMGITFDELMACGGGGSSPLWRQMLADVLGCGVQTAVSKEGPALGAAILAGVGAGIYPSVAEGCSRIIKVNAKQQPLNEEAYSAYYNLYHKLYGALREQFSELAHI